MDSLSERLKSLGVHLGDPGKKPKRVSFPIHSVFDLSIWETPAGEAYYLESSFPLDSPHGAIHLKMPTSFGLVADWGGGHEIDRAAPEAFAFLDTETTGLSGGAGTFAFLVGVGRFEAGSFRLLQFFLRDPSEELAMLTALESFLSPCEHLVTYNGRSFDYPLLLSRFISNGWERAWEPQGHLDLLHLARRLWRDRYPSRALGDMENLVLGVTRDEIEVPGWLVPQLYQDYLRSGDARPLKGVFYHNQMDILSLVGLLDHMAIMLTEPYEQDSLHQLEQLAIARLLEDLGRTEEAALMYTRGLEQPMPDENYLAAIRRLSFLRKRNNQFEQALALWRLAAARGEIYAYVELAKFYEHHSRDLAEALSWTQQAMAWLEESEKRVLIRAQWWEALAHRRRRLERKLGYPLG